MKLNLAATYENWACVSGNRQLLPREYAPKAIETEAASEAVLSPLVRSVHIPNYRYRRRLIGSRFKTLQYAALTHIIQEQYTTGVLKVSPISFRGQDRSSPP
jgi:hypothetical protein